MDREKVIKATEYAFDVWLDEYCGCSCITEDEVQKAKEDALALLKEQEAVEPTFKQDKDGIFVWACGSCGAYMYHIYDGIDKAKEYAKFCRQCGKAVRWE